MWQENNSEMVGRWPVETGSLHQHHFGFLQHFQEELLVVLDGINLGIELGEHVKRSSRLDARHTRYSIDQLVSQVSLLAQTAAGIDQLIDALVSAQCRLNGPLPWHVGTQAHVGQHVQTFDVIFGRTLVACEKHPTSAVATRPVAFGQRIESDGEHILTEAGNGRVLHTIVQNFVVHLIGKNYQAMLAGNVHNALQRCIGVQSTRRIVGVDDHNAFGLGGDLGADIVDVGHPSLGLIAHVVNRCAARQTGSSCPQRIVGGWQ